MGNYNLADPGFVLVPFFQNRKDTMGFILKVNANTNILLNVVIQRDDYATPDALMDMLAIAVDAIIQDRPVVYNSYPAPSPKSRTK
jgi:hypothetical protein